MEMSNGGVPPQTPPGPGKNVNRFFVFCKKCNDTQPGKLRVRCDKCKDEGFVLRGDPQEWNDVLTKRKLRGTCYKGSCGGDQHAEFFFKCANHQTALQSLAQTEEKCVALHMLRVNAVGMDCPLCYDVKDVMVVFNCDNRDGHSLCLECFVSYATLELNERRFIEHRECGYTIQCPSRCTNSFVTEIHHFYLLGKELYEKYQKFGAEECLLQMGGILCPSPDCGCGMLPENNGRSLTCPECRFNFCRECKAEYHRGPCNVAAPLNNQAVGQGQQIDPARLNRSRWDEATRNFIQSNDMIKQCPNCQTYIEKNRGCMHMTCTRCRFEFCWLCMTRWGRNCMDAHWFG
jgi:parkin